MRRRAEVLTQAYDLGEISPIKIEEYYLRAVEDVQSAAQLRVRP